MAENRTLSNEVGAVPTGVLRLAGGSDIMDLVVPPMAAPDRAIIDYASRRSDESPQPETHNANRIAPPTFTSMMERLRRFRNTTVGRLTLSATLASSTAAMAACGHDSTQVPDRPSAVIERGGQGGGAPAVIGAGDRHIIGDAACYEGFGALPESAQEACADAFTKFTLEEVGQLAPLDQARWMVDYRAALPGNEGAAPLLVSWDKMLHSPKGPSLVADILMGDHNDNVFLLSWLMQQPDNAVAEDPRTLAALFGLGTTADSQAVKDAVLLASSGQGNGMSFKDYSRRGAINQAQPFGSSATDAKLDGNTLTFTGTRKDGSKKVFTYTFNKTGYYASLGELGFHKDPSEADYMGEALIGMPANG